MRTEASNEIRVEVACGSLEKANCRIVLPRIATYTNPNGIALSAVRSEGSVESTFGVCRGAIAAALVQGDASDMVARQTECVGKFQKVGQSVFPYYGFLVARADADYSSMSRMAENRPRDRAWKIAAGKTGSGAQVTLQNILRHKAGWANSLAEVLDVADDDAARVLLDRTIDAYFMMDGFTSELVEKFRDAKDARGNPQFKFVEVDLGSEFYQNVQDWQNRPLYREVVLQQRWFLLPNRKTISVDGHMIVSRGFLSSTSANGQAIGTIVSNSLADAITRSLPNVRADLRVPDSWQPQ